MPSKIADLAVKIGSYQKNGESKGRYETIGTLFQGDDGGQFVTLKPYSDLWAMYQLQARDAKANGKEARDTLMVSCFTDEGRQDSGTTKPASKPSADLNDDIPF